MPQTKSAKAYTYILNRDFIMADICRAFPVFSNLVIHDMADEIDDKKMEKELNFHINSNDLFGTLATLADLLLQENDEKDEERIKLLEKIRDDLLYLQKNYKIVHK